MLLWNIFSGMSGLYQGILRSGEYVMKHTTCLAAWGGWWDVQTGVIRHQCAPMVFAEEEPALIFPAGAKSIEGATFNHG